MAKDKFTLALEELESASDIVRIRECEVCKRIFWAGRLDARQCGDKKCKSALSTRRWREGKEQYNKARSKKRAKAQHAPERSSAKKGK